MQVQLIQCDYQSTQTRRMVLVKKAFPLGGKIQDHLDVFLKSWSPYFACPWQNCNLSSKFRKFLFGYSGKERNFFLIPFQFPPPSGKRLGNKTFMKSQLQVDVLPSPSYKGTTIADVIPSRSNLVIQKCILYFRFFINIVKRTNFEFQNQQSQIQEEQGMWKVLI